MRPLRIVMLLSAALLLSVPAYAVPISPLDPKIGVRGRDSGSPTIFNGAFFELEPCDFGLPTLYFCAPYEAQLVEGGTGPAVLLNSLDLRFADLAGLLIPTTVGGDPEGPPNFEADPDFSDFPFIAFLNEFDVRLAADPDPGSEFPPEEPNFLNCSDGDGFDPCLHLRVFSDQDGFVSIRAVNRVSNLNLTETVIPEPATFMLLATGLGALAARRSRRRNGSR